MGTKEDKTRIQRQRNEIGRRDLFRLLLPREGSVFFVSMEIEADRCSLCGLCARVCPTEAMNIKGDQDVEIIFRQEACDACGRCREVCPEECLRLERVLSVDDKRAAPVVLIGDQLVRCSSCGEPVGPRRMIQRLQSKLRTAGIPSGEGHYSGLLLCQACKTIRHLAGDKGNGRSD